MSAIKWMLVVENQHTQLIIAFYMESRKKLSPAGGEWNYDTLSSAPCFSYCWPVSEWRREGGNNWPLILSSQIIYCDNYEVDWSLSGSGDALPLL